MVGLGRGKQRCWVEGAFGSAVMAVGMRVREGLEFVDSTLVKVGMV